MLIITELFGHRHPKYKHCLRSTDTISLLKYVTTQLLHKINYQYQKGTQILYIKTIHLKIHIMERSILEVPRYVQLS